MGIRSGLLTNGATGYITPCSTKFLEASFNNSQSSSSACGGGLPRASLAIGPNSSRNEKASRKSLGFDLISFPRWHGMIRLKSHLLISSTKASTFSGSLFKINFCKIGATKTPPCNALKFGNSLFTQSHGYSPIKTIISGTHDQKLHLNVNWINLPPLRGIAPAPNFFISGVTSFKPFIAS